MTPSQKKPSLPLSQTKLGKQLKADDNDGYNSDIEEPEWEPSAKETWPSDDEVDDLFPEEPKRKPRKNLRPAIRPLQTRSNMGEAHLSQEETEKFQRRALEQMGVVPPPLTSQESTVTEDASSSNSTVKGNEVEWVLLQDATNGTYRRTTTELAISAPESPIDAFHVLPTAKKILMETWTGLTDDRIKIAVSFSHGNTTFIKTTYKLSLLRTLAKRNAKTNKPRPKGMEAQTLSSFHFSLERSGLLV